MEEGCYKGGDGLEAFPQKEDKDTHLKNSFFISFLYLQISSLKLQ